MSPENTFSPLIVLIGPTAVGKTELSLHIAEHLNAEIISADSRLFYRGMDIGTAKPAKAEMARVPHHLIDVAQPDETWSLAMFQQKAREIIAEIHQRNKIPMLVGGTGQYIRAVTEGWTPPRVEPDPRLRSVLESLSEQHSPYWLHDKLKILDPTAAANIDARNVRRTIRALEVILASGEPFSRLRSSSASEYHLLTIGLMRPRAELYARVDERIELMFKNGLLDEVRELLGKGYAPELPSLSAIGYREAVAVIRGEMTLEEAKTRMKRITRVFVRRQSNWFKEDDPLIRWFSMNDNTSQMVTGHITSWLAKNTHQAG